VWKKAGARTHSLRAKPRLHKRKRTQVSRRKETKRAKAAYAKQAIRDKLIEHKQYIAKRGEDLSEIRNWKWGANKV
jgi:phosphoketolase